jgi:hypothetical protein
MTKVQVIFGLCVVVSLLVVASGCESKQAQFGDKKEDWNKTAPPPQWRGPGQPGGPPPGALSGPGGPPPAAGNPAPR